ncbi:hypothetical protein ACIBL3_40450 [Kribbella sp. NPDC050124]|uniref:hypothetical protein n=1 Tax=Kribbella sp. NPDC050124 TaxID=3364114 RepID=UPI00378C4A52
MSTADELDNWLIATAGKAGERAYDASRQLIRMSASPSSVHTALGGQPVHAYRESATYALILLETAAADDALGILDRVLSGQDLDPASATYGIWPYYLEEPLDEMVRPDTNWADFIGQELVLIMLRHAARLPEQLRDRLRAAIAAAAEAIIRRDVPMSYTNIAAKGTFVVLGAGQVLDDPDLTRHGRERIERLAASVRETGSFAEYNSPTYWLVTCTAMSAVSQLITDRRSATIASGLVDQLWHHLVRRWHQPSGQFSGPMSRAYRNDLAEEPQLLAHLCKAVGGHPPFDRALERVDDGSAAALGLIHTALLQSQASEDVVHRFRTAGPPSMRRELFSRGRPDRIGSTWLHSSNTLGTVNFADSWFQRRNLLGYWGANDAWRHPAPSVRLRVVKDEVDFVSAVFSSVQQGPHALWHIGFASPGGDHHVHRNLIPAGQPVMMRSVQVLFEFRGMTDPVIRINGLPGGGRFALRDQVTVSEGRSTVLVTPAGGSWGGAGPTGRITSGPDGVLTLALELLSVTEPEPVDLSALGTAFAGGSISLLPDGEAAPAAPVSSASRDGLVTWSWAPGPHLDLTGRATVGTIEQHGDTHTATIDRQPLAVRCRTNM